MATATLETPSPELTSVPSSDPSSAKPVGDYLLTGILMMLVVNFGQRVVGLVRGLGFCHFLSEEQLGAWALANSFFVLGVPLALLGLPGSFGKFAEYYRCRNQLGDYLVNVLSVTCIGFFATLLWMCCASDSFSWLVFDQSATTPLVVWCAIAFACLVLFSVVYEVVASLRQVRVLSIMQFLQSVVFAIIGLLLIALYGDWLWLLPSYAVACVVATLPGIWVLYSQHRSDFIPSGTLERRAMWARILPFAASLWLMNLLSNMFEVSDRYMLLHLCSGGHEAGQAAVGQYHCGRILPNLLISVALMLGGVLLPYLSADWEAGQRERIAARMRQMIQSASIGLIAFSIAALSVAPILFQHGFGGRYAAAEAILPLALLQAVWVSLFLIAETYMLCAERGKELALVLIVGLAVNLGLNWFMIQRFGLVGAVAATSSAGLLSLLLLFWRMSRSGCALGAATSLLCVAPLALAAGPVAASAVLVGIVLIAGRTDWLLTAEDRQQIDAAILPRLERCGVRIASLWP